MHDDGGHHVYRLNSHPVVNRRRRRGSQTHGNPFYRRYGHGAGQCLYYPLPERLAQGTQINEGATKRPWYCRNGDYYIILVISQITGKSAQKSYNISNIPHKEIS